LTAGPALSVVLVTPDGFATLRRTVRALRAQGAPERLELVIVAPRPSVLDGAEDELRGFGRVRLVAVGPVGSGGAAKAAGIRAASAPLVALGEDHSFPEPGWAEALIAAHRGPWAAVAPRVEAANPASTLSWANHLPDFGAWLDAPAGPMERLPWHNTSYKRDLLLRYGDRLEVLLTIESLLHEALRADGHRLYLEPAARTRHLNVSRLQSALPDQYHAGRTFGGIRAREGHWPTRRRLLYVASAPAIPPVRLWRLLPLLRSPARPTRPPLSRLLPALVGLLVAHTLGETAGYLLGPGRSPAFKSAMEFHRERHLRRGDLGHGPAR
jgi:hypothetical protein